MSITMTNPENGEEEQPRTNDPSNTIVELPPLTEEQQVKVEKARRFVDEYNRSHRGVHPSVSNPSIHLAALQSMQQAAHMIILCRIYVGSINFELSEQDIRAVFETFGPIRQLNMSIDPLTSKHKGYCFVEYETAEAASLALATMDGAMLGGRTLRVGRPNNYPANLGSIGLTNAPGERIYLSNVHTAIGEEDIWTIFKVFGDIRAVVLVPNILTGRHKGYGYIEFEQETSATMAVTAMNQFLLGGVTLRVGRAIVGGPLPAGMTGTVYRPKESSSIKTIEEPSSTTTVNSSEPSSIMDQVILIYVSRTSCADKNLGTLFPLILP